MAAAWRAAGLLTAGGRVLVALSGGADSVALAALLHAARGAGLPLDLTLAHLDHGWRGPAEAALDLEVVREVAARLDLPLLVEGPPTPPVPGEAAARRWRYATLARLARGVGATEVAVGHHLRDQAETVLLRLLHGSGPYGLTGMRPARPLDGGRLRVVRPLLGIHPDDLRAFNRARGLRWREDPTNAGPGARNDARRRLLAWEAGASDATQALVALAARVEARLERRHAAARERTRRAAQLVAPGAAVRLPRALWAPLAPADLAEALRVLGESIGAAADGPWFTRRHVLRVGELLQAGGALDLPRGLALRFSPRWVWLLRRRPPPLERWRLESRPVPRAEVAPERLTLVRGPLEAVLDSEVLGATPRLRRLRPGDTFTPFGRGAGGPVAAQAWLKRHGIPAAARAALLVVEGARGVAWLVGLRIDARHAVRADTRSAVLLQIVEPDRA